MIGPARPEDVAAIARLEAVSLGADAWSEGLIEQGVAGALPTVHYRVARAADAEAVSGYAVASVAGDVAELQRIAVAPRERRTGVASGLLDDVVRLATADGADRLLIEVREDNTGARAFYDARGFAELDRRPRYYRDGSTAVVMVRTLTGPEVKEWTTS